MGRSAGKPAPRPLPPTLEVLALNNHEFQMLPLDKIKHLFNASEREQLAKYGNWAKSLEQGYTNPNTERQEHFVSVCRGVNEPKTDFEFLWLRYRAAIETENRIARLEGLLSSAKHEANGLRKSLFEQIEKSKSESQNQEALIKKLQNTLTSYERKLGLIEPPKPAVTAETGTREICPNCCGDGGASGQCYKCGGSGWVFV